MSFNSGWGYEDPCNEYGQEPKIIPKAEEFLNRAMNDYVVEFSFHLHPQGYDHIQVTIVDDFELESVRKLSLYLLQRAPNGLVNVSDNKTIDLFLPKSLKWKSDVLASNIQHDLGLCITFGVLENDAFYCINFLPSAVQLKIESGLHSHRWISLHEAGQEGMFLGVRYLSVPHVFHAVSVVNLTCSTVDTLVKVTARFQAKYIRYIPIISALDQSTFQWTASSAAKLSSLQVSFSTKVNCFLWTTGEECILKEAVFGREESNLPYLTAQENVSRRQGYVQYLPDSRSRLETYYVTSHGPLLQEHFLVSETERLRQEFLNVYRNRTGCTEDVLRTLKCTMFLVETPLGDRYVPFQAVVSAVSEYCGQSRTFADDIATVFCETLCGIPGISAVSNPKHIGARSLQPFSIAGFEAIFKQLKTPRRKRKCAAPIEKNSPFARASDLARWREARPVEVIEEDEVSLKSTVACPGDAFDDRTQVDTNVESGDFFDLFTCGEDMGIRTPPRPPPRSPPADRVAEAVAREIRRRDSRAPDRHVLLGSTHDEAMIDQHEDSELGHSRRRYKVTPRHSEALARAPMRVTVPHEEPPTSAGDSRAVTNLGRGGPKRSKSSKTS